MPDKTRQQRRAKARSPLKKRRRGAIAFLTLMLVILIGGGFLVALFRANPPPLTRGASAGEHWHASYKIFVCGKQMEPYPTVEGELHSHADGFIHLHPQTQTGNLASLRTFLLLYETNLGLNQKGERELTFPDGKKYSDGDTCGKSKKKNDIVVTNKGEPVTGDPGAFLPHDGDTIEIAFGSKGKKTFKNPYAVENNIQEPVQGGPEPAPD